MTASISNTEQRCILCLECYKEDEINDVDKRIRLVCGDVFHTACYARDYQNKRSQNQSILCSYCEQLHVPKVQWCNPFSSKEAFQTSLNTIEKEYDHDADVKTVLYYVNGVRDQLLNLHKSLPKSPSVWLLQRAENFLVRVSETIVQGHLDPEDANARRVQEEFRPVLLSILQNQVFNVIFGQEFLQEESFVENRCSFLSNEQEFRLWMDGIIQGQGYDNFKTACIYRGLSSLYPSLKSFESQACEHYDQNLIEHKNAFINFITTCKKIPEEFRPMACKVVEAMFTGIPILRNVKQEAHRWLDEKDLPKKIQDKGVLVEYTGVTDRDENFQARISAEQLTFVRDKIDAVERLQVIESRRKIIRQEINRKRNRENLAGGLLAFVCLATILLAQAALRR